MNLEKALFDLGVEPTDLDKAKSYQAKYGGHLERLLVNMGALAEEQLPALYGALLNVDVLTRDDFKDWVPPKKVAAIDTNFLFSWASALVSISDNAIKVVSADPLNWELEQYLESTPFDYQLVVSTTDVIEFLQSQVQGSDSQQELQEELSEVEEDRLRELASEAPVVNLLNSLISRALKYRASDMHIEPYEGRCRIRFRVDGVLLDIETVPKRMQLPLISRLKILSGMDIAEKRRPQDGKIEMKIASVDLDIRVSALPLNDGESVVMRFLRKDSVTYDMAVLGLSPDIQSWVREDLQHTAGVVLLTGPTGSGKTTSLYTFLNELNSSEVKIITLEDPVEYQLDGVNQVQVRPDIGFDFSAGLRSIVRQDPDVIMLGEIRDAETARIAMQSALTGHLVFSTVHTNDAPSAYTRLLDLGVDEFLLNAALLSVVAQRLARKVCPHCSEPSVNQSQLIEQYGLQQLATKYGLQEINLLESHGCDECAGSGYRGRLAIIEYLRIDETLKSIPKDENFLLAAKKHNAECGRRTLLEDGFLKAMKGETTIEEVLRVAG